MSQFLIAIDLLGTFVFALSGAATGVKKRLDLFGLAVLAVTAGNVGGIARDVLISSTPPAAIEDWRYVGVSTLAAVAMFFWHPRIDVRGRPILLLDAAGLGLFAVAGAHKALGAGLHPVMAALMGMLSGIGGGMVRDVLVNETPAVLESDLYAVAALAAGAVVVVGDWLHWPSFAAPVAGALLCFWLRVMAIFCGWRLPIARTGD